MQATKTKWGIVGSGPVSEYFIDSLFQIAGQEIAGVYSTNREAVDRIAQKYDLKAYETLEELSLDSEVTNVYIASPNSYHYDHAKMLIRRRKNVLIEKPMVLKESEAVSLIELATINEVTLLENLWTKFSPAFMELVSIIEQGTIGKIKDIEVEFSHDVLERKLNSKSRYRFNKVLDKIHLDLAYRFSVPLQLRITGKYRKKSLNIPHLRADRGQGAISDFGIYGISLTESILGYPHELKVVKGPLIRGVDSWVVLNFGYSNKAKARIKCNLFGKQTSSAKVWGSKGVISLNSLHNPTRIETRLHHSPEIATTLVFDDLGFIPIINEFLRANQSSKGQTSHHTYESMINTSKLIEVARKIISEND